MMNKKLFLGLGGLMVVVVAGVVVGITRKGNKEEATQEQGMSPEEKEVYLAELTKSIGKVPTEKFPLELLAKYAQVMGDYKSDELDIDEIITELEAIISSIGIDVLEEVVEVVEEVPEVTETTDTKEEPVVEEVVEEVTTPEEPQVEVVETEEEVIVPESTETKEEPDVEVSEETVAETTVEDKPEVVEEVPESTETKEEPAVEVSEETVAETAEEKKEQEPATPEPKVEDTKPSSKVNQQPKQVKKATNKKKNGSKK